MYEDLTLTPDATQTITAARPAGQLSLVPYARVISNTNTYDCPFDRYMLFRKMAKLEFSKDNMGGEVIGLQVLLRSCPECERQFIDQRQLTALKDAGLDIRGFDILGSAEFPRTKGYEKWHPDAIKKVTHAAVAVPAAKPKTVRKPRAKKAVIVTAAE